MKKHSYNTVKPAHEHGDRFNERPPKGTGESPSVLTKDGEHEHSLDRAHARHPDRHGLGKHEQHGK